MGKEALINSIPIQRGENVAEIRYESERKVVEFLFQVNPDLRIVYEPRMYQVDPEIAKRENLRKKSTVPDFEVVNPETGDVVVLEVTEQRSASCKSRQRRVMELSAPGVEYIIFSRNDLAVLDDIAQNPTMTRFSECGRDRVRKIGERFLPKSAQTMRPGIEYPIGSKETSEAPTMPTPYT